MPVETEYQCVITCDKCGDNLIEAYWSQANTIREARKLGWSIGKKVLCPKCKEANNGR
jgi:hypothetical protein